MDLSEGIGDRIIQVRGKRTQHAFAQSIQIAKITLLRYEKGERVPDAETVARICENHSIDYTWLITGKGSPTELERYIPIPQYDISASAGMGACLDDCPEVEMVMVDKHWLEDQLKVNPQEVSLIFARGDSMEPTINNGDVLLVCNKEQPIQEGIFVIRSDSLLQVKRIQRQTGAMLRITSDNPAYEPFTVNLADENLDFKIIGKVIWTIKRLGN
jgi:transcriptional regulator with XRE-family HTH domain